VGDAGAAGMTSITVDGKVTFNNTGAPDADGVVWTFSETKGWFDGAPAKGGTTDRPQQHGTFAERTWRGARMPIVTGHVTAPTRRLASDAQRTLAALLAEGTFGDFAVDDPDQGLLTSSVRGEGTPQIDWDGQCDIDCLLTFLAPDPLRYGTPITAVTGFPVATGGLAFPLYTNRTIRTGGLWFGARSSTGRVLLTNSGDADAWVSYTLDGPLAAQGCEVAVVGTGALHRFQGAIPAGSTVLVEGATGTVLMDGYSDRSGQMTRMDPLVIPAHGSLELALIPLGSTSAAQLSATFSPGYW